MSALLFNHPFDVLLLFLFPALPVARYLLRANGEKTAELFRRGEDRWSKIALLGMAVIYAGVVIAYIRLPHVYDHAETLLPAWAWLFHTGHPLYNKVTDAARYSTVYGPVGSLIYSWSMGVLGPSLQTCKVVAGLSGALSLLFVYLTLRKEFPATVARWGTAGAILLYLQFAMQSFMTKHDPFIALFTAFALWASACLPRVAATLGVAVGLGALANMKVHAPFYALPALYWLLVRHGRRSAVLAVLAAGVFTVLPFLHPQISFQDWLSGIAMAGASEGLGEDELFGNLQWLALFGLPFLVHALAFGRQGAGPLPSQDRGFLGVFAAATVLVALVASKVGSGPYHFLPVVPGLVIGYCLLLRRHYESPPRGEMGWLGYGALAGVLASLVVIGAAQQVTMFSSLSQSSEISRSVYEEVEEIQRQSGGKSVAMGYGSNRSLFQSLHFLPLVFSNQPFHFNFSAMLCFHDQFVSESGRQVISRKEVQFWLIPRGEEPFTVQSFYRPHPPVFDEAFRSEFAKSYERSASTRFFDIYAIRSSDPARQSGREPHPGLTRRGLRRALPGIDLLPRGQLRRRPWG